ncbi:hypothetical protein [Helicobacter bizzozeronii]|nr:hypothetical protein [Helicobacter bizzozeronii]
MEIQVSNEFERWLDKLKDLNARDAIARRIDALQESGHFGDHKHIVAQSLSSAYTRDRGIASMQPSGVIRW